MTYKVFFIIGNKRDRAIVDAKDKAEAIEKATKEMAEAYETDALMVDTVALDDTRYRLEYLDGGGWKKDSDHDTLAEARKAQRKLRNMTGYKTHVWAYQYWREV